MKDFILIVADHPVASGAVILAALFGLEEICTMLVQLMRAYRHKDY